MGLVCGDVRDLIVSHKTDHGPAHRRYRALQQSRSLEICFREIFGIVLFSTFATISANRRHGAISWNGMRPPNEATEAAYGCCRSCSSLRTDQNIERLVSLLRRLSVLECVRETEDRIR